jgi:methanogenic corrinoid protein MtbC1
VTTADPTVSLLAAVESYDAEAIDAVLRDLLRDRPLGRAVNDVLLPFLREVGERWEAGDLSVAHEHFFTHLLTRRLSGLTSPEPVGEGPVVVLACPPGERHEVVLLCFGLLLGERGVRARFLGADTPMTAIVGAVRTSGADALVLAAIRPTALIAHARTLNKLAEKHTVHVAGQGADAEVARVLGATLLPQDPVAALDVVLEGLSVAPAQAQR